MIRKLTALFALVLALGMTIMPAAAQDMGGDVLSKYGVESGYLRIYTIDPASAGTPSADTASAGTPSADTVSTGTPAVEVVSVVVGGIQFDSAESAEKSFEDFTCGFAGGFMGAEEGEVENCGDLESLDITVNQDLEINGDAAIEITGEVDFGSPVPATLLAVQSDNYIFLVINLGVAESGSADSLGGYLADAEPTDTQVEFNEDGTSTGGFFDMLPKEGAPELNGMIPAGDLDIMGLAS